MSIKYFPFKSRSVLFLLLPRDECLALIFDIFFYIHALFDFTESKITSPKTSSLNRVLGSGDLHPLIHVLSVQLFALAIATAASCMQMLTDNTLLSRHSICLLFWPGAVVWIHSVFLTHEEINISCKISQARGNESTKFPPKFLLYPLQVWNSQSASSRNQCQALHIAMPLMEPSNAVYGRLLKLDLHPGWGSNFILPELKLFLDMSLLFL